MMVLIKNLKNILEAQRNIRGPDLSPPGHLPSWCFLQCSPLDLGEVDVGRRGPREPRQPLGTLAEGWSGLPWSTESVLDICGRKRMPLKSPRRGDLFCSLFKAPTNNKYHAFLPRLSLSLDLGESSRRAKSGGPVSLPRLMWSVEGTGDGANAWNVLLCFPVGQAASCPSHLSLTHHIRVSH